MKSNKIPLTALLCAIIGALVVITDASAQTYFADNFDNPKESEKKWFPLYG
jgi:hypothetical protein